MDGTVVESYLNWPEIKKELNLDNGNILKEIYKNNTTDFNKLKILEKYERLNTLKTKPIKGINEYLDYLRLKKVKTALVTNNNKKNTDYLLKKFNIAFDSVITREMNLWKPEPDAFLYLMKTYNFTSDQIISVGDSHYDVKASRAANIRQIYIIQTDGKNLPDDAEVFYFHNFIQLKDIFINRYQISKNTNFA
jgi:HAD superfamily hydrolase (TIGR01509 family)